MKPSNSLYLLVESPSDLYQQLSVLAQKEQLRGRHAYLALADKDVILKSFDLKAPADAIKTRIAMDAIDLLSIPMQDISLDYQILTQDDKQIKGIYACMKRQRLGEYSYALSKFGLYPAQMIPYGLVVANYFLFNHDLGDKQYIVLSCFKPSWAICGVFMQKQCVLIRLIHYESVEELKTEVDASILNAYANSPLKQCSGVYFFGEYDQKEQLLEHYHNKFGAQIFNEGVMDLPSTFSEKNKLFMVHLFKNEILSFEASRKFFCYLTVLCIILWLFVIGIGTLLVQQNNQMHQLQATLQSLKGK